MIFNRSRKGTEKPIEIFVALFIILAVSVIMLKMFQNQISSKQEQINEEQQQIEIEQKKTEAEIECAELCSTAKSQGCTDKARANYCLKILQVDLNGDSVMGNYEEGNVNRCEAQQYCQHFQDCRCGVELNFENCVEIICNNKVKFQGDSVKSDANPIFQLTSGKDACDSSDNYWSLPSKNTCQAFFAP
ncbi:hypothetical protein H6504_01995 [Candidatus Woesearchaeota archaeon]|nr:hypothetical protein [Candidatus Woesearchaeota archaeon]